MKKIIASPANRTALPDRSSQLPNQVDAAAVAASQLALQPSDTAVQRRGEVGSASARPSAAQSGPAAHDRSESRNPVQSPVFRQEAQNHRQRHRHSRQLGRR